LILEIIPKGGIGVAKPEVIEATQVVIKQADGTPIGVAAEYGPEGAHAVSHAGDDDFNKILEALGIDRLVITDSLYLDGAGGAKLVRGEQP